MSLDKFSTIMPIAMAVQAFIAGGIYIFADKWGSAMYWYCACAITIAVLLIPRYG